MTLYYGSNVADATLTTACDMSTTSGGTEVSTTTSVSGGNHFCEIYSQGGSQSSQASIGTPSGKGWVSSPPGAGIFAAGNWSASITASFASWSSGNTLTVRFYRYSAGVYTSIGSIVATVTGTTKTTYSFAATAMGSSTFGASDLLYVDLWLTDNSGTGGDNPTIYVGNSASVGVTNDMQITTSSFGPSSSQVNKDVAWLGKVSSTISKDIAWLGKLAKGSTRDITWLGKLVAPLPQVGIAISNLAVIFEENTFQLHLKADERQRFQATILDYAGTAQFFRGQKITVDDPTLGRLFSGVIVDDTFDRQNSSPDPTLEHQIDTVGNEYFADKRTVNRLYTTPTYSSSIVFDAVVDALASEGIVAPFARRIDSSKADWSAGILTNTVATSNVDNGDLELFNTGGSVSVAYLASTDWNTGTFSNTQANSGGDLSLIGFTRNWDDGSKDNQTLWGNGSPSDNISNKQYLLTCAPNLAALSRMDFAGNWTNFIMEVDVVLTNDNSRKSMTWATTNWTNYDDYAYAVELRNSSIELRIGTNGANGATSSLGSHNFSNALSAGTYRLRVVRSGNTYTAFVNGTQYVSASDSTYTTAAMVAIRNRNTTSASLTDKFDNFGIMQATSGTWTSGSTSINAVTTIASSVITWDTSLSQGGTILIQSSIDGGSTFQTCSNGGVIPNLIAGSSGTGKNVVIKVSLSTPTTGTMPDIRNLQWSVVGGYVASGTRVSPSLDLGACGRIGSTIVAWNANLPSAATTLGVDTSIDGGMTWTDVSNNNGGPIPGLNGQPEPTIDGFSANTLTNYLNTNGTNGSAALWSFDTANSRVVSTNGASAILAWSSISVANIDVFADMDYSDAGGLAFCMSSSDNYYGLVAADNRASVGVPNSLTLYKVSAGVQSTLASAPITFVRGTWHRVRVSNLDGLLTASFDGVTVFSTTDMSPLSAGLAGLLQTGGFTAHWATRPFMGSIDLGNSGGASTTARFYQLWIQPLGDNATGKSVMTRCRLATTDSTITPQVFDLTVAAYSQNVNVGTLIPSGDYRMQFINKVLDDLAKQSNYAWWIDQAKTLNFRHRSAVPAPWILQSSSLGLPVDLEDDTNLKVEIANDLFRNRQNITGVLNTGPFTSNFQGDGQTSSFTLQYPIAVGTMPVVVLNNVIQKVGKKGTTGAQFYYADSDAVIAQDANLTKLISSDRLVVNYTGIYTTTVTLDNTASQTALALTEGGSGIVEAVEDVSSRNMMYAAAQTYAQQLLTRYCLSGRTLTFATYRNGLYPGQILSVFLPELGIFDIQMLITAIDIAVMYTQPNNTILYQYVVTATELPNIGSWAKLLASSILLT